MNKPRYVNLFREMAGRQIEIGSIADFLGMHRNSVSRKIHGIQPMTIEEAIAIRDRFFPDMSLDNLFKKG